MTKPEAQDIVLGSDLPLTDPAQDAFGYAPFARRIADTVCRTPSPQGLVMAVHGQWGVGKSTLLNFIKHDLAHVPQDKQPIVIDFNPWWFNDRAHLVSQFLSQFRANLPRKVNALRKLGDSLADYGTAISSTVEIIPGIPAWLAKGIGFISWLLRSKPKDVPAIKSEIFDSLKRANQRFVFMIDDIDRLAPDEIRELFKVIKALADFPNVIYLLAFDRSTVATSLCASLGVDGEAYLEKIVQVPFILPAVDHSQLTKKLFEELDRTLESLPLSNFDQTYWGNIYLDGLDHYITKPRDIVRVANAFSVLYPAVVGEINPVDFIAVEFLRIFEPEVYGTIHANKDKFAGSSDRGSESDLKPERLFHNAWLERVPPERRNSVKDLVRRMFPRLDAVWNNTFHGGTWLAQWQKELRICSPEIFDIYFQFGVSRDRLRRADLEALVVTGIKPEEATRILTSASEVKRLGGISKAREYLDRLQEVDDKITPEVAAALLGALFAVGDALLSPADEQGGIIAIPNRWRHMWAINLLLNHIPREQQTSLLLKLASDCKAVGLLAYMVTFIEYYQAKPGETRDEPLDRLGAETLDKLRSIVVSRLSSLEPQEFLAIPDLAYILGHWTAWAEKDSVSAKITPLLNSEEYLPAFLEKYLSIGRRQALGDRVARRIPRLNPKRLESLTDISALESRVQQMLHKIDLTPDQRTAGEQFIKGMEQIRQGKDPDNPFNND